VAHNGAYCTDEGNICCLPDRVFEIIGMMKVAQKVLVQEEDADQEGEDGNKGVKILSVCFFL
jgi:hypothetical protein